MNNVFRRRLPASIRLAAARRWNSAKAQDYSDVDSRSVEDLRTLVKQQKAHIQEITVELARTKAQRLNLGDEEANDVMKQRLFQMAVVLAFCGFISLFYQYRQNRVLTSGLNQLAATVKEKMLTMKQEVKNLEAAWAVELAKKEEQLTLMHQQSTEQTRSIDRLTTAIRSLEKSSA
ncbi:hypothetical protein DIPPA_33322 [Diplonema papillatum]|nr:hypothetical protein DIPPA_11802 [Diplonema papillatum]KAJ9444994.1 hypothetical protein DIPPA_33322 [Diplonema papillatum]